MSFYNMLFGRNGQSDLLLAVIGLRENDVERFRDVHASGDGTSIYVYTRTGGGNRGDYPNRILRKAAGWQGSEDDDYDSTYCLDTFQVPAKWAADVAALTDVFANGIRKPFAKHLAKTLRREPTDSDKAAAAYESERQELAKQAHSMANGHTFVPHNDYAMEVALKLAEAHGGKLRSCWGILPIKLTVEQNKSPYPNARDATIRDHLVRVEVGYSHRWEIDDDYWQHCLRRFIEKYPLSMAAIAESVTRYLAKDAA